MSDLWRIVVVEGEEAFNRNVVNTLRKDGYEVQGVANGADAVRILWSEEYDLVICDLKTPGAEGFELLQWLRAYRPNTRMIMIGSADTPAQRLQALESGAVGYLEKPVDMRVLREEIRRSLQQNGFTASLDSFDLLDVIQIITLSRKSITLLINIGLEERGILRFQNGELIWAEYGILRGEEAFFALAAHKNGTVTQQFWDEQVVSNVTQPLSRLIFQALQYRTKYADRHQYTGEQPVVQPAEFSPVLSTEIDDSPFAFLPEELSPQQVSSEGVGAADPWSMAAYQEQGAANGYESKEWWERTGEMARVQDGAAKIKSAPLAGTIAKDIDASTLTGDVTQVPVRQEQSPAAETRMDLPSWLTDQPTAENLPVLGSATAKKRVVQVPLTPIVRGPSGEWPAVPTAAKTTDDLVSRSVSAPLAVPAQEQPSGATWSPARERRDGVGTTQTNSGMQPVAPLHESNPALTATGQRAVARRNYAALVSALQTLGYSIGGFIAAAVVGIEGQPIAQVAIEDMDISKMCKHFSAIQKSILFTLEQGGWSDYEETVITSRDQHLLMRMIGNERRAFLVLLTVREANPAESLEVMANVEGAISAALR